MDEPPKMSQSFSIRHGWRLSIADLAWYPAGGDKCYYFNRINVPESMRGQGFGKQLLNQVVEWADANQYTIILEINPYGQLNKQQLRALYARFGWVNQEDGSMLRPPKNLANDFHVGAHYELSDGRLVRTFSCNGRADPKTVGYYFDDGEGGREALLSETATWKLRDDLHDFPNARDPILPYVFDLFWDIKYRSQLVRQVNGHDDEADIREQMAKHDIRL